MTKDKRNLNRLKPTNALDIFDSWEAPGSCPSPGLTISQAKQRSKSTAGGGKGLGLKLAASANCAWTGMNFVQSDNHK